MHKKNWINKQLKELAHREFSDFCWLNLTLFVAKTYISYFYKHLFTNFQTFLAVIKHWQCIISLTKPHHQCLPLETVLIMSVKMIKWRITSALSQNKQTLRMALVPK